MKCDHDKYPGGCLICPPPSGTVAGTSPGDAIRRANLSEERVVEAIRSLKYNFIAGVVRSRKGSVEDHSLCDVTAHTDAGDIRFQVKSSRGAMKVWRRRIKNHPEKGRFLDGLIIVVAGDRSVRELADELAPKITEAYMKLCHSFHERSDA
jgi:hypothetical protein